MEELLKKIEEISNLRELKKLITENGIEIDIKGMSLDDAKSAVIEALKAEDENVDDADESDVDDEADEADSDTDEGDDESDDSDEKPKAKRNAKKRTESMTEIALKMAKDPNRDCDIITREIKYLNSIRDEDGEFGEYSTGTMTLAEPIEGYVAETDPVTGNVTYVLGDQTMIRIIIPSFINTLRESPELASVYNKIRDDDTLLYKVLAGTKVKMVVEYVSANTEWTNPLSRNRTKIVRTFDHDTVIATVFDIVALGPSGELWTDLEMLNGIADLNPGVVLALLDKTKKKMRRR